jgi:hypothetical protein
VLHTGYFLITPRPELVSRIERAGGSELSDLAEARLWTAVEYDKGSLSQTDTELLVKFMFVDTVVRENESIAGYEVVFPELSLSEKAFDSNWQLTRIGLIDTVAEAVTDAIDTDSIDALIDAAPNERLKEYLLTRREHGVPPQEFTPT